MTERESEKTLATGCEDTIRGERLRPSPRLQRRLQHWIDAKAEERSGAVHRRWPGLNWAAALGVVFLLAVVFLRWDESGSGELPLGPVEMAGEVQLLPEEYLGMEDLLVDMDLLVFAHVEEFIFYEWMVY